MDKVGTKYCILENDGVSLCVCKHRPCEQLQRAKAEIDDIKTEYEVFKNIASAECKRARAEVERLEDTCNELRKRHNEDTTRLSAEVMELKAENERLKLSERDLSRICQAFKKDIETEKSYTLKYYKTLQEIREMATLFHSVNGNKDLDCFKNNILTKINEVIGVD